MFITSFLAFTAAYIIFIAYKLGQKKTLPVSCGELVHDDHLDEYKKQHFGEDGVMIAVKQFPSGTFAKWNEVVGVRANGQDLQI